MKIFVFYRKSSCKRFNKTPDGNSVALEVITNLKENSQVQQELSNVTYKQQIQQHLQGH